MVKICTIIVILECDIEYISPSECLQIAPLKNGEVNGRHPEAQMDPYEDVVKAHLEKLEKQKVSIDQSQTNKNLSPLPPSILTLSTG